MRAISVLYGGRLESEAYEVIAFSRETAFSMSLAAALKFPGVQKTVFFGVEGKEYPSLPPNVDRVLRPAWTRKSLLEELSAASSGYDLTYFAWADCPLLDPVLAAALAERHKRYGAEYSYADGWPYGFAPELLSPGTAGILAKLAEADYGPVDREAIFKVLQKDINAFDIETEISPVDLRPYRLNLAADSKRNLLLLSRFMEAGRAKKPDGLVSAADAETIIKEKPELLRTLPAFFNIQITGACPQTCSLCPWPIYGGGRKDFMSATPFAAILDKIADFAGDGVIDLSLWGEAALHPEKMEIIESVLARPALSLIIETSGIGWKTEELEAVAQAAAIKAAPRKNHMAPVSWIVSLDAHDHDRYREVRGSGFSEAKSCAQKLLALFPNDTYVQAVRVKDFEDDIERFYRSWKDEPAGRKDGSHIIIQKYDDFAGALPKMQATDLSPVKRRPCWHIHRDMNILLDGSVPCCREDLGALKGKGDKEILGNVFTGDLRLIWEKGAALFMEHCKAEYKGICAGCDEYYTFNF